MEQRKERKELLWLIDFRVLCHTIARAHCDRTDLGFHEGLSALEFAELSWHVAFNYLPARVQETAGRLGVTHWRPVVCDDYPVQNPGDDAPKYWRHGIVPSYKGGRRPKPESWNAVTLAGYLVAENQGIPVVSSPTFEADDVIARYVRDRANYPTVGLVGIWSVDTDLTQLVTDEGVPVIWYDAGPWEPLYRDVEGVREHWLRRYKHLIASPKEIADYKAQHGDPSDNLPAGTDLGVISLWDPIRTPPGSGAWALKEYPPRPIKSAQGLFDEASLEAMIAGAVHFWP